MPCLTRPTLLREIHYLGIQLVKSSLWKADIDADNEIAGLYTFHSNIFIPCVVSLQKISGDGSPQFRLFR